MLCEKCSAEIRRKNKTEVLEQRRFWPELMDHIKRKWEYKKRPHGKFDPSAKELTILKKKVGIYSVFDVMALYDEFIVNDNNFYCRMGHSLETFCHAIPALVDKKDWKERSNKYRDALIPESEELKELRQFAFGIPKAENIVNQLRKEQLKREGLLS